MGTHAFKNEIFGHTPHSASKDVISISGRYHWEDLCSTLTYHTLLALAQQRSA